MSLAEEQVLARLRLVAADASSVTSLANRALGALQPLLGFDEGEIFAVDSDSLVLTDLFGYVGTDFERLMHWLDHVYLVKEPLDAEPVCFPTLLREHGGLAVIHEDVGRWIGVTPAVVDRQRFVRLYRSIKSPPGGGLRMGLSHKGRWIAALQLARWNPGPGFSMREVRFLERVRPRLAAAFAKHLYRRPASATRPSPGRGHALFDSRRRLRAVDPAAERWLKRLRVGAAAAGDKHMPVVIRSTLAYLIRYDVPSVGATTVDRDGTPVAIRAHRMLPTGTGSTTSFLVTMSMTGRSPGVLLTPRRREIARALSRGLTDREIGAALHVSSETVHEHVAAIHRMYGTRTRSGLVAQLTSEFLHETGE